MNPKSPRDAVLAYFDAVRDADADAFAGLFSPGVSFEDPVGTPALSGTDGVRRFHKGLRRAWQSLVMTADDVVVRGPSVAATWHAQGTSAGGKPIAFRGINTFRVDDEGRIEELRGYWDFEGVVAQM